MTVHLASSAETPRLPLARRSFIGRTAALGAAALGAPAALAACGGASGSGMNGDDLAEITGGDDYVPGSAELKHDLAPEIDGINYKDGYVGPKARELEPFGDGETEFTILSQVDPDMDMQTNYYSQLLEEKTGLHATYVTVPAGEDGKTRVNAIVAGGDLPHGMMVGQDIFNPSEISIYGQQGLFLPLDKLIDENAPHVVDMFESFPDMREQYTAPDGKLYAVPSMNDCYHCKSASVRTWINARWLEGVGAEAPTTLDEFDDLMDEFRDWDGKPDGSVLTTADAELMMYLVQFFLGSFLEIPGTSETGDFWLRRDGETIEWLHEDPAFREGIIWVQGQFEKGNFDRNIFSNTNDQYIRLGDNPEGPQFGVGYGYSTAHFCAAPDYSDPDSPALIMQPLAPMEGPDGVRTCRWDHFMYGYPNFVVTPSCPDPAQLIRWADYQFELGLTISLGAGERGVTWDWADEGVLGQRGEQATYAAIPDAEDGRNDRWREWGPLYKSVDQRDGQAETEQDPPILERAGELYEPYATREESGIPPRVFDTEQSAQIGEIGTNLENHFKETMAGFGTGRLDASDDGDWESYLQTCRSIGIESFVDINQMAYDQQYGA